MAGREGPYKRDFNTTSYVHPNEENLNNLHKTMQYNNAGEPVIRTHVDGITLEGDVIVDKVRVEVNAAGDTITPDTPVSISKDDNPNSSSNPIFVDANITGGNVNANVSGTVTVSSITNTANVNVLNIPSVTINSGTVTIQDGGNTITVDGSVTATISGTPTVNIGTMPEVEIKNDTGNPIPISKNTTVNSNTNPIFVKGTSDTSFFDPVQSDAFGRLRVSNPFTLFDGGLRYDDDPFKWNQQTLGSGTGTFLPDESSILMSVLGNGDSVVRQSKSVFSYQPGKSLLIMTTFAMNTLTAGLHQRVGYFGEQNGVYLEANGTTVNLVIRKYTSGSVDDTTEKIPQSSWNGNTLLGTLDLTKTQIWWCDVEWLGVGSVRSGFVINGQFIVCHTFHHANILNKVYMTTATLPVRYELTSTGAAGSMRAICSTVISEGGYINRSISRAIGTPLTGRNLSDTVYRPLVCIRLKSTRLDSVIVPSKFDVYGLQQAAFAYRVIINPTLTNASWTSIDDNSSVEYDISATALSGGTVIDQGIFVGSNKGGSASVSSSDVDFSQQLGRTIAGVSDIWCLAAIATTNNDDAVGAVTWQEHT